MKKSVALLIFFLSSISIASAMNYGERGNEMAHFIQQRFGNVNPARQVESSSSSDEDLREPRAQPTSRCGGFHLDPQEVAERMAILEGAADILFTEDMTKRERAGLCQFIHYTDAEKIRARIEGIRRYAARLLPIDMRSEDRYRNSAGLLEIDSYKLTASMAVIEEAADVLFTENMTEGDRSQIWQVIADDYATAERIRAGIEGVRRYAARLLPLNMNGADRISVIKGLLSPAFDGETWSPRVTVIEEAVTRDNPDGFFVGLMTRDEERVLFLKYIAISETWLLGEMAPHAAMFFNGGALSITNRNFVIYMLSRLNRDTRANQIRIIGEQLKPVVADFLDDVAFMDFLRFLTGIDQRLMRPL